MTTKESPSPCVLPLDFGLLVCRVAVDIIIFLVMWVILDAIAARASKYLPAEAAKLVKNRSRESVMRERKAEEFFVKTDRVQRWKSPRLAADGVGHGADSKVGIANNE